MLNLNKYRRVTKKVYAVLPKYRAMSDEELQAQTAIFQVALEKGSTIKQLLPAIFAVVIEADRRVLGMEPYFVQVLGGIALFFGNVAEIKTGEGKTLVATMPLYAHALMGKKGNFLITANEYLAKRDGTTMGAVFRWLGLTVGIGTEELNYQQKAKLYNSDIIYATHSRLGFDYLFDNLGTEIEQQVVNRFNFAVIDEIDAVLLDEAQTSLIISGAPKVQSDLYEISNWFFNSLVESDYELSEDERNVWYSDAGLEKINQFFDVSDIFSKEHFELYTHLVLALQANILKEKGHDYLVEDGAVLLLDDTNGRKLDGVKLTGGLHQAIEVKESVALTKETKTLGVISYQSLFQKFKRLSGMTGTAKTDEKEFLETYHLRVIQIPTHEPLIRIDQIDQLYITNRAKIDASIELVKRALQAGSPVLIATGSVNMSRLYSLLLLQHKIPHNLLNAENVARENRIIDEAGQVGAVTVATAMAGRGTDIKLSAKAKENGGLVVVGTERMSNQRVDNQLRGRAGRQGEPGESQFFVSLEDQIVTENASNRTRRYHEKMLRKIEAGMVEVDQILSSPQSAHLIDKAQQAQRNMETMQRRSTIAHAVILGDQRDKVYNTRKQVLNDQQGELNRLIELATMVTISDFVRQKENMTVEAVSSFVFNNVDETVPLARIEQALTGQVKGGQVQALLEQIVEETKVNVQKQLPHPLQEQYFKKIIVLKAIDDAWVDQLDYLQQLQAIVNSRATAQHKPINEYGLEARRSFLKMEHQIQLNIFRNLLMSKIESNSNGSFDLAFP